jgi:FkbM family methyltransferase
MGILKHSIDRARSISFTLFNRIENNNNAEFSSNGEERFLHELFGKFSGPVVLFDIGGNIGGYSEILVGECRRRTLKYDLHIFEPTASCFEILQSKFNGDPQVHLNNVGVSNADGAREIFYDIERSGFASLYQRNLTSLNVEMKKKESISLIRLEEYLLSNAVQGIDFLKIDIEGHELHAFEGMGKYLNGDFIKVIQFEYGGANLDSRTNLLDLYTLLTSRGFVLCKIMRNSIEQRDYQPWMDNFQYANYLAVSKQFYSILMK